jgi:hypothetical protein
MERLRDDDRLHPVLEKLLDTRKAEVMAAAGLVPGAPGTGLTRGDGE